MATVKGVVLPRDNQDCDLDSSHLRGTEFKNVYNEAKGKIAAMRAAPMG